MMRVSELAGSWRSARPLDQDISVIVCAHNPRRDDPHARLGALSAQTLPRDAWELVLVDNASKEPLAGAYDLSWHAAARHVREEELGATPARLRGIAEARGELIVYVDDDTHDHTDISERGADPR